MTKKQKKMLSRILISAFLFLLLYTVPAQGVVRLLLYLIPVSYTHLDVYKRQVLQDCPLLMLAQGQTWSFTPVSVRRGERPPIRHRSRRATFPQEGGGA